MGTGRPDSTEWEEKTGKGVIQVLGRESLLFLYLCVSGAFSFKAGGERKKQVVMLWWWLRNGEVWGLPFRGRSVSVTGARRGETGPQFGGPGEGVKTLQI